MAPGTKIGLLCDRLKLVYVFSVKRRSRSRVRCRGGRAGGVVPREASRRREAGAVDPAAVARISVLLLQLVDQFRRAAPDPPGEKLARLIARGFFPIASVYQYRQ